MRQLNEHILTTSFVAQAFDFRSKNRASLNRCAMLPWYGTVSACFSDQASVRWAGIPPSGANGVGRHMRSPVRSLRTLRL